MKIRLETKNELLSAFNYSSLTDIVMLLLIFFLLTSSFIATKGIAVRLPDAANTTVADSRQVSVELLRDGRIIVNGSETAPASLRGALQALATDPARQLVVLSSDRDVPVASAVYVMDEAKAAGLSRFFISTAPKEQRHGDAPR
jgi:biopolymer transport protein ExbD